MAVNNFVNLDGNQVLKLITEQTKGIIEKNLPTIKIRPSIIYHQLNKYQYKERIHRVSFCIHFSSTYGYTLKFVCKT
jgi:hypothetical protein